MEAGRARTTTRRAKMFLGRDVPGGPDGARRISIRRSTRSSTTRTSAPFVSRQLIQQLVTSNPSPAYVARHRGGLQRAGATRGDLAAVVRAILTHPEAARRRRRRRASWPSRCCSSSSLLRALERDRDRPSVHERRGRGDGPEGVLSRRRCSATSRRATACAAPRARAAARRTRVPDPDVGHRARARELRRRRCSAAASATDVTIDYDPVHEPGGRPRGARGLLQPDLHGRPDVGRRARRNHRRRAGDAGQQRDRTRADGAVSDARRRAVQVDR